MTVRKISIAAAVSLSLSGITSVYALGLGEIEMYSALNQTLDAEIAILSATDAELRDMQVRLASPNAFARAGLQLSPTLSSVGFEVDQRPDGKAVVKVTSDTPVLEPFLNFLLEVDAPGSVKLVREYTVLLNPPTFAAGETAGVRQSGSGSSGFVNSANNSGGVSVDLGAGNTFEGNDTGSEVVFTETTIGTFTEPPVTTEADGGLFLPDSQVLNEAPAASTVVDSDGQVISLVQEVNTTPQVDNGFDGGEVIALDNLDAQDGNAIFTNEFDSTGGEVIAGSELAEFVDDVATFSEPVVQLDEPSVLQQSGNIFVADLASTDTDAQGGGELIDLSGVFDDSGSSAREVVINPTTNGSDSGGFAVEIDSQAQSRSSGSVELSGRTYRIRSEDTLWSIANAQKSSGITAYQMIVALLDANPNAFIGGNMNRMRNGAVLQIPTAGAQNAIDRSDAFAVVQSWTRNNRPPARSSNLSSSVTEPTRVFEDTNVAVDNSSDFNSNLDDVNERYEQVQNEVVEGTFERDELQGRVDSLTDNMEEMKSLITVRESELNQLQDEVLAAESNAAAIDEQISQLNSASQNVAAVQQGLRGELNEAQEAIARRADADTNLATAEAEAKAVMLSSEEDALRSQLAALELEKRELEASSQLERAELVREAEAEKNRLLAQAQAEKENIRAELEAEKARISREAEVEIARAKDEAGLENQRLLKEAQAQRDEVAAESEDLQAKLAQMEASLLEESQNDTASQQTETMAAIDSGSSEPARVKDRLAQLQEEAGATAAAAKESMADTKAAMADKASMADTDADGTMNAVDKLKGAGKTMAAGGAAAVGGLLGFAPLENMVGNRKTVLAAGAGLSLFGLLAAWGLRRRKDEPAKAKGLRPRGEGRPVVAPSARSNAQQEEAMYGDVDQMDVKPQRRSSTSAAAAAAAAAAAVTGTAAVAASGKESDSEKPLAPKPVERSAASSHIDNQASTVPTPQATAPAQSATAEVASDSSDAKTVDAELEETALDDTITEAEVYLRYGLHGQAEDLLKTAIERSPKNSAYHFKLLENYHDQKNADDFKALAETYQNKFPNSGHKARIAEMAAELDSSDGASGVGGALTAGAAGAAALATGAVASAKGAAGGVKDTAVDGIDSFTSKSDIGDSAEVDFLQNSSDMSSEDMNTDLLDQTIDPGSEFSLDELQATGNLGAYVDDETDLTEPGGMSLDDVDLASLDDDGTMNLEEIAGDRMSGGDLGSLDLTNPDVDTSFENLSLEDANLDTFGGSVGGASLGDDIGDLTNDNMVAGGTDEMETMLDLAKAYIDMGDNENAGKSLKDVAARGNPLQQTEATELLKKLT